MWSDFGQQIQDRVNGFLVSSVQEAADAILRILKDNSLKEKLGKAARETVQNHFLISRKLEQLIDLASAFEPSFSPNRQRLAALAPATIPDFGTFPGDAT